uniref:Uncharacterized protein n=1 Tax=Knipowitschia caucasica TaxID=637954 RepID=A0AAV2M0D6_KNICA
MRSGRRVESKSDDPEAAARRAHERMQLSVASLSAKLEQAFKEVQRPQKVADRPPKHGLSWRRESHEWSGHAVRTWLSRCCVLWWAGEARGKPGDASRRTDSSADVQQHPQTSSLSTWCPSAAWRKL